MISEKEYWIWLQCTIGYASTKVKKVLEVFGSPEELYKSSYKVRIQSRLFTDKQLDRMQNYSLSYCKNVMQKAYRLGQRVVPYDDDEYPRILRDTHNCPAVLYVRGKIPNVDDNLAISVIGSRKATSYGMRMSFDLAYKLAQKDIIIVSGGAVGVDIQSHIGTLKARGTGICVLACGCDFPYLTQNDNIKNALTEKGAVISEFMPGTPVGSSNFQTRNRIMSGLSRGVVVVEAASRSGTMITVNYALSQGRDVFVLPGNIDSPFSKGANMLIKEGAKPVTEIEDILEEYKDGLKHEPFKKFKQIDFKKYNHRQITISEIQAGENPPKIDSKKEQQEKRKIAEEKAKKILEGATEGTIKVYKSLTYEDQTLEQIIEKSSLNIRFVLAYLTDLELKGIVTALPGKKYKLSE